MLKVHGSSVPSTLRYQIVYPQFPFRYSKHLPLSLLTLFLLRLSNSMIVVYAVDSLEDLGEVVS